MAKKKPKKGSWIVTIKAEVTKEVYCYDCTESEAREKPFDHADYERELEQIDWEVRSVEPND